MRRYAAGAVCLFVCLLVVEIDTGPRWSWPLFGWGLVVGALGVVGTVAVGRLAGIDGAGWEAYPSFILMSVGLATLAAGLHSAWPDLAFAAYVAVANFAVPLVLLRFSRVAPPAHACGTGVGCATTACAGCPLASQKTTIA